jgi:putative SOS response-associated peptidase YedK
MAESALTGSTFGVGICAVAMVIPPRRESVVLSTQVCKVGIEANGNMRPNDASPSLDRHCNQMERWGLIPNWSKNPSIASGTINAKSETAATKPGFRDPLKFRRCLIPADGFYEWKRTGAATQPFCFDLNDGELFAFAGLWDGWKNAEGQWIKSCSILTTTPNTVTATVHDRMPVILDRESYDLARSQHDQTCRSFRNC